jgi:Flp pilus assembly protein TadG
MIRDRGSAAVELVLLTPLLVMLVVFVVHVGRAGDAMTSVRHAADQGARAASLVSEGRMGDAARRAVIGDLARGDHACVDPSVVVTTTMSGNVEWVTVRVSCSTNADGLELLGVGETALVATSTEVVDRFRGGD